MITKEGFTLSVDMVRLAFKFKGEKDIYELYQQLEFADLGMHCNLKKEDIDPTRPLILYDFYQRKGGKFGTYKTLFTIYVDERKQDSFSLGIGLQNNKETLLEGFIEFNPNKCAGVVLEWFLIFLQCHCKYLMLKRYDLALDVPIRGDYIVVEKDNRKYELHSPNRDRQYDTEYLGVRNTKGRFKKYNKKKEYNDSHPFGEPMLEELTRLELTLESLDFRGCQNSFPVVKIPASLCDWNYPNDLFEIMAMFEKEEQAKEEKNKALEALKDTELVLLELLLKVDDIQERKAYVDRLGRVMKNKLKPLVYDDATERIEIHEADFYKCMSKLCEYCRLRNTIVVGKKSVVDDTSGRQPEKEKKPKKNPTWCAIVDDSGEIFGLYDPITKRWESKEAKKQFMDAVNYTG